MTRNYQDEEMRKAIVEGFDNSTKKFKINSSSQYYNPETKSFEYVATAQNGVHICVPEVDTTTGIVLVDKSDTTNFPHNNTNDLYVTGYQISINPDDAFRGQILMGFLENVDESGGDFKPVLCWYLDRKSDMINEALALASPICACSDNFLVAGNLADSTWQTDTALTSPAGTSAPGDGDIVMKIKRTAGEVSVGVTIKYFSK